MSGFKDKIVSLFKSKTPKHPVYQRGKKLSKPKTQIKIRNPFMLKKKKKTKLKKEYLDIFEHRNRRKKTQKKQK